MLTSTACNIKVLAFLHIVFTNVCKHDINTYLCPRMSTIFKQLLSSFLLCVFCLYITPKEVIHTLTHHLDTEHHVVNDKDGLAISNPHHHCELMKMDQQFSAVDMPIPFFGFSSQAVFFDLSSTTLHQEVFNSQVFASKQLRAPPVFVV